MSDCWLAHVVTLQAASEADKIEKEQKSYTAQLASSARQSQHHYQTQRQQQQQQHANAATQQLVAQQQLQQQQCVSPQDMPFAPQSPSSAFLRLVLAPLRFLVPSQSYSFAPV